jgi:CRP-like cAMP-binding protein
MSSQIGTLNQTDLDWIKKTGKSLKLQPDQTLIQPETKINELYFLSEGSLKLWVSSDTQEEIGTVETGNFIGEMALIDGQPASIGVKAAENCQLSVISWQDLKTKIKQDLSFASRFYQTITASLSKRLKGISALLVRSKVVSSPPLRKVLFVFGVLNDRDIDWIAKTGFKKQSPPGTLLIEQNQPVESIYILLEGTLSVSITIPDNGVMVSKEVAQLPSGEIVGEMSFIDMGNASATVTTATSSSLLGIPKVKLATKLEQDLGFASRFYQAMAVILVDRLRDRLSRRGYGSLDYRQGESLEEDIEYEDELNLDTLEQTSLASTRFDWLVKRV